MSQFFIGTMLAFYAENFLKQEVYIYINLYIDINPTKTQYENSILTERLDLDF